jgi:hypothetical protein
MHYFKSALFDFGIVLILVGVVTLLFTSGKTHVVVPPATPAAPNAFEFEASYTEYDLRPLGLLIAGAAVAGFAVWRAQSN